MRDDVTEKRIKQNITEDVSDLEVINNVLEGDVEQFSVLVDRYQKKIFSLVYKYLYDVDETEDLTQDIFLKIYDNLSKYRAKSSFGTYIYRIAINECISFLKLKRKKEKQLSELKERIISSDKALSIDDTVDKLSSKGILNKVMEALNDYATDKQRSIFILKHFEGFTIRAIAEIMEMKEGTVKSHLNRCINKLKSHLGELYEASY